MNVLSIVLLLSCITFAKSQYEVTSKDKCTWSKCEYDGYNGDALCGKSARFFGKTEKCDQYNKKVQCCVLAISKPGCKWTDACLPTYYDRYSRGCTTTFGQDYENVRQVRCRGFAKSYAHECCPKKKA